MEGENGDRLVMKGKMAIIFGRHPSAVGFHFCNYNPIAGESYFVRSALLAIGCQLFAALQIPGRWVTTECLSLRVKAYQRLIYPNGHLKRWITTDVRSIVMPGWSPSNPPYETDTFDRFLK